MHIDARYLDNNTLIEGDICIIGAGAAGISMALEWIGKSQKIILLEGGGFEFETRMQDLFKGKNTGQRYHQMEHTRLHYFGGTTGHWTGFCSPLDPIDFKKRDWVPYSGWPIQREDLDPFYARAHKNLDLGPFEYNSAYYEQLDRSLVPLPFDNEVVCNKMWQFSPPTRFGKKYKDTIINAKNIHLYTYANVTDITANENVSAITEVTAKNFTGKQFKVRAKYFVFACCAVQTTRLLLSANRQAPKGIGNDNDLVGRYFMEHLEIESAEMWFANPNLLKLYLFEAGKTKYRAELGLTEQKQRELKILNSTIYLNQSVTTEKDLSFVGRLKAFGKEMRNNMTNAPHEAQRGTGQKGVRKFTFRTRVEQAPNPNSRITLDTAVDELGMRRVNLNWELTPFEKRSVRKINEVIGMQLGIASIGRTKLTKLFHDENDYSWPLIGPGTCHHIGTTRMSDNPKQGVVDTNCKVYGVENLYVAGSSCFVTAGGPNPTLTIVALTIRLADHLKQKFQV